MGLSNHEFLLSVVGIDFVITIIGMTSTGCHPESSFKDKDLYFYGIITTVPQVPVDIHQIWSIYMNILWEEAKIEPTYLYTKSR